MNGVTNKYIEDFLRPVTKHFIGVFSANNLPKHLSKSETFSLICNHDNLGEAGSHFISIVHVGICILYIDSLGFPCTIDDIRNFLWSFQLPVFYNSRQLQSVDSSFCGFYCILYVLHFDQMFNYHVLPPKLVFNVIELNENDMLCIKQIRKLLRNM
jgi:hypothetical protein